MFVLLWLKKGEWFGSVSMYPLQEANGVARARKISSDKKRKHDQGN
ncbi:MAG: hypothetical protein IIC58_12770 [Proteobacteria bacterium]|nr:hypothetical protein [Pseudomonadota bacterium]